MYVCMMLTEVRVHDSLCAITMYFRTERKDAHMGSALRRTLTRIVLDDITKDIQGEILSGCIFVYGVVCR